MPKGLSDNQADDWHNLIPMFSFQVVANYYGNKKIYEPVEGKQIYWAGGRSSPPPDTPKCGFDGSGCPPDGECLTTCIIINDLIA